MKRQLIAAAIATGALAMSACETTPKTSAALESARSAVRQAEEDPGVTQHAPSELDRARKLLVNAEGAAKEKGANDKIAVHYAYLAGQMARIAEQRAREQIAIARVKSGEEERQKILLAARENEAHKAISQAREAQAQASAAQAQAEAARNEAQTAAAQMAQAQAEKQQLASQLADLKTSETSRGIVLTMNDVLFDTGEADLKPGAGRSLDEIANFLQEHPERHVQVEGFTDSQGPDEYNRELSQRRADAVAQAIIARGVDQDRVKALGYGEEFPVASNANNGSRQLNRRVEIVVSKGSGDIPSRTSAGAP